MLRLYYAPGACSMAAHIVLEEGGEAYEAKRVDLAKGEQRSAAYLKINPQGRVPALRLDSGETVSENTAILPFLGKRYGLWPKEPVAEARAMSTIGFFAASVHPAHAHISRPERYASDSAHYPNIQETGRKAFHDYLKQIDARLAGRQWLGEDYSVLDPTLSSSTPGACAASCRWRSSRATPPSPTACWSVQPSAASSRRRTSNSSPSARGKRCRLARPSRPHPDEPAWRSGSRDCRGG